MSSSEILEISLAIDSFLTTHYPHNSQDSQSNLFTPSMRYTIHSSQLKLAIATFQVPARMRNNDYQQQTIPCSHINTAESIIEETVVPE